jgi:hypothetical protein
MCGPAPYCSASGSSWQSARRYRAELAIHGTNIEHAGRNIAFDALVGELQMPLSRD